MTTMHHNAQPGTHGRTGRNGGCGYPLRKAFWRGWVRLLSRLSRLRRREPADLW